MTSSQVKEALRERIIDAGTKGTKCLPVGGNSKALFGDSEVGEFLSTESLQEISAYEPTELVITAGAGTPLNEIETALRGERQMLGFEALGRQTRRLVGRLPVDSAGLRGRSGAR